MAQAYFKQSLLYMKHGSIRFAFLLLYGHPLNTDTSLLRTVVFVAVESPYSLNSARLIQRPVNMRTTDTCFVPNKQIVMDSLPAVINLFLSSFKLTLRVTACRCFQLYSIQDRTDCRLRFQSILAPNELCRERFLNK